MLKTVNKYHLFWIAAWGIVFVYILIADMVVSGTVEYHKDFSKNQFGISYLFPLGRTVVGDHGQTIAGEPLYVTVYTPRSFEQAEVTIMFTAPPRGWRMGYQVGPGFQYELVNLGDTERQVLTFDISRAYYENNRLRFILANKDFSDHTMLTVQALSVTLKRKEGLAVREYLTVWKTNIQQRYDSIF